MKFKIGESVKFLNTTGGGVISRIIDNTMVHVTIEDGFDIPVMVKDIISTGERGSAAANIFTRAKESEKETAGNPAVGVRADIQKSYEPGTYSGADMDRGVYLAFRPMDQRVLTLGDMEVMLINHTDYPLICQLYLKQEKELHFKKQFPVAAKQSIILEQIAPKDIESWLNGALQFMVQPRQTDTLYVPSHTSFSFKGQKFFREDSYRNTSLDPHKIICFLLKHIDKFRLPENSHSDRKESSAPLPPTEKKTKQPPMIHQHMTSDGYAEVDLHIGALIDDHNSLNPMEAFQIQMRYFQRCLDSVLMERIKKMVVIHGVGNGILKAEILKVVAELPFATPYDAPIRKYGVGATVIEFHHTKNL